jgi:hypothetical protein
MPTVGATGSFSSTTAPTTQGTSSSASGGNLLAVPWNMIQINPDQHVLIVNAAASSLTSAPTFSADNWPDLFGTEWNSTSQTFWSGVKSGSNSSNTSGGSAMPTGTATP